MEFIEEIKVILMPMIGVLPPVSKALTIWQASWIFAATLFQINCLWMIFRTLSHYQMPRKEIKQRKIGQTFRKSFLIVKSIKMWNKYSLRERIDAHLWDFKNRARLTLRKENWGQNSLLARRWTGWHNGSFPSVILMLLWCFHLSGNLVSKADF